MVRVASRQRAGGLTSSEPGREGAFRGPTASGLPVRGSILEAIGETPLVRLSGFLDVDDVELYAKLESMNPGGSAKDRPAVQMIEAAIRTERIGPGSVVVESSSGNTGIGLAQACRYYGLRFVCVVDARTQPQNLAIMRALGAEVEFVGEPFDGRRDLLGARLDRVVELVADIAGAYWPNQYANPQNPLAHEVGTMAEIDRALDGRADVVFVAMSSTGTIGGCQDYVTNHGRATQLVGVDSVGSVLFGGSSGARSIPGLGAGHVPALAVERDLKDLVRVSDLDCVVGCRRVAATDAILVGGSAGGVLQAVRARQHQLRGRTCVALLADSGHRYLDSVFDDEWVEDTLGCPPDRLASLVGPLPASRL